jgi:hypothetical protein
MKRSKGRRKMKNREEKGEGEGADGQTCNLDQMRRCK